MRQLITECIGVILSVAAINFAGQIKSYSLGNLKGYVIYLIVIIFLLRKKKMPEVINMNTEKILSYLSELEKNNNREWYHNNKEFYKEANEEFEKLIQELIFRIGETDKSILHLLPNKLTFKLVRDTRYSHDKSPYNPCFRAHISSKGKMPVPVGYYILIRPGNRSFLGGGLFAPMFTEATAMVRDYISAHGKEFQKIISDRNFVESFSVKGEALKNVPRGYDENHPQAEYLKNKSWYLEYTIPDRLIINSEAFLTEAVNKFVLMQPFNNYLNKALKGFEMPSR